MRATAKRPRLSSSNGARKPNCDARDATRHVFSSHISKLLGRDRWLGPTSPFVGRAFQADEVDWLSKLAPDVRGIRVDNRGHCQSARNIDPLSASNIAPCWCLLGRAVSRSWSGLRRRSARVARWSGSVLEAPAIVASFDDLAVVRQTIEQRRGHFGVAEDRGPFPEGEIGGDDDRGLLVEAR